MRRDVAFLIALVVLGLSGACGPTGSPSDTACDPKGCLSLSQFSQAIAVRLIDNVVGYVVHVGGVAPAAWGPARTSTNPPSLAMSPDLEMNLASVGKTLTAIGVIQSLAAHNLTVDDKISPYLWPNWQRGPGIQNITFRELLTHSAGIYNCPGDDYASLQKLIAQGITSTLPAPPLYSNCDFTLFREMIPFMEGAQIDIQTCESWGTPPGTCSADFYVNYMNQQVFQPLGLPTQYCKPTAGGNEILSYPYPAGTTSGIDWGDSTLICGAGGWVMTANNLFAVINDLATGNVLLNNDEKKLMNSPNCLGWDCAVGRDCPSPYVCKNGGLNGANDINLRTYTGIFKCNVPVVVLVNSKLPAPDDTIPQVAAAYSAVNDPTKTAPCPAPPAGEVRVRPTARPRTPVPLPLQTRIPIEPLPPTLRPPTPAPRETPVLRPPILVSPVAGAAVDCGRGTLTWKPVTPDVRDYDVELERLDDHSFVPEQAFSALRGESTPFEPACDTRYRWRARDADSAGRQSDWSPYAYFRGRPSPSAAPTRTPTPRDSQAPRPPDQLAPLDGVELPCAQVTLKWQPATNPSGIRDYDVELEKLVDRTYVTDKTWNTLRADAVAFAPECGTPYRWRIRATDTAGRQSEWSGYQDFEVIGN